MSIVGELNFVEAAAYAAVASGVLAVLAGTAKAWWPQVKYAALWVLWQLLRPTFTPSAVWTRAYTRHCVPRHRARLAWLDPAGRARAVRRWVRVVRWGLVDDCRRVRAWRRRAVAVWAERPLFDAAWLVGAA